MTTPQGNFVDDRATGQDKAREMLRLFIDNGFAGDLNETAMALGRRGEDLSGLLEGREDIDDDLAIKMRGIAQNRGFVIE
jgi:plasmid maintenance system antidote protein VapI